jgi:hypothetical protein
VIMATASRLFRFGTARYAPVHQFME